MANTSRHKRFAQDRAAPIYSVASDPTNLGLEAADGWVVFNVKHLGGSHQLRMKYAPPAVSSSYQIRINGNVLKNMVAGATPVSKDVGKMCFLRSCCNKSCACFKRPPSAPVERWFDEGEYDLGPEGEAEVAFRFQHSVSSFQLIPSAFLILPRSKVYSFVTDPIAKPSTWDDDEGKAYGFSKKETDEWVVFVVRHLGGPHTLRMKYTSAESRPCIIRINDDEKPIPVADADTGLWEFIDGYNYWFDEGQYDLGSAGQAKVAFAPSNKRFPLLANLQFVPVTYPRKEVTQDVRTKYSGDAVSPVTFTFRIGPNAPKLRTIDTCLAGKYVAFKGRTCHERIQINGKTFGDQKTPGAMQRCRKFEQDDRISRVTIGISDSGTEREHFAAFKDLRLVAKDGDDGKVDVRAVLDESLGIWEYDRKRIGLNLWITAVSASPCSNISRYDFTLSSDHDLTFNEDEFDIFWNWLVRIRRPGLKERQLAEKSSNLSDLRRFLSSSFQKGNTASHEGVLFGTNVYTYIIFDVFSITIYRLSDGETLQSCLFVDGVQFDDEDCSFNTSDCTRNALLSLAISSAMKDIDLLYGMNLMEYEDVERDGEILKVRKEKPLFLGDYSKNECAQRVVSFLGEVGLRQISTDEVMSADVAHWDIYLVAAGSNWSSGWPIMLSAIFCGMLQIAAPIALSVRAFQQPEKAVPVDVIILRFLFGIYFIAYAYKSYKTAKGEARLRSWLGALPEFSTAAIALGVLANKIAAIAVNVGVVALMIRTNTAQDTTLRALTLFFILKLDDNLVTGNSLNQLRSVQQKQLNICKSQKTALYRLKKSQKTALYRLKNTTDVLEYGFEAWFNAHIVHIMKIASCISMLFLFVGTLAMVVDGIQNFAG